MIDPEKALKLAEDISAKRAELKALEAEFYSYFGAAKEQANTCADKKESTDSGSVTEMMRQVFYSNPGKIVTVPDFMKALPHGTPIKTVRATVNRIVVKSDGRIVTVKPGQYKLLEQ